MRATGTGLSASGGGQLHEASLNVSVDPTSPLWLRCPYDVSNLPEDVVEERPAATRTSRTSNQLRDLVQIRSPERGSVFRIVSWI